MDRNNRAGNTWGQNGNGWEHGNGWENGNGWEQNWENQEVQFDGPSEDLGQDGNTWGQNQNTWEQNPYNQNQYGQSWGNPEYNTNNTKQSSRRKPKKPKKAKKRGGCLVFLLKLLAFILVIVLIRKGGNILIDKDMEQFEHYYPFALSDGDNLQNITDDFSIQNYYIGENGKEYEVEWTVPEGLFNVTDNDTYITCEFDQDTLTSQKTVTLEATYKKFIFWKRSLDYDITIVPSNSTITNVIEPLSIQSIEDKTYPYTVEARISPDGILLSLTGDIKNNTDGNWENLLVQNELDAYKVLVAYKDTFSLGDYVDFQYDSLSTIGNIKIYSFNILVNGVNIDGQYATVQTDKVTSQVNDISCQVDRENLEIVADSIQNQQHISEDELSLESIQKIIQNSGIEELNVSEVYNAVYIEQKVITVGSSNMLCKVYNITFNDLGMYTIQIQSDTNEIVSYVNNVRDFQIVPEPEYIEIDGKPVDGTYTTEKGQKKDIDLFEVEDGVFFKTTKYTLHDPSRQLQVFDETFIFDLANGIEVDADGNLWDVAKALAKLGLWGAIQLFDIDTNKIIHFDTNDQQEKAAASEAYQNMQLAYDWYYEQLGIHSYDSNGAPIIVIDAYGKMTDNAACVYGPSCSYFVLGVPGILDYQLCTDLAVIGHEYTHAVFTDKIGKISNPGVELLGINEGCADIFGVLMTPELNWNIGETSINGKHYIIRDIANYSGENVLNSGPSTYKGDDWEEKFEEHLISVLIQHIAYEMSISGLFSRDDIAQIWLTSMQYGYNADQTFVDCRKNVMKSMKVLGYSKNLQDRAAEFWDAENILDPDYIITTKQAEEEAAEEKLNTAFESMGLSLSQLNCNGDTVIFVQVLGQTINKTPIYIWQADNNDIHMQKEQQEEFSELLSEAVGSIGVEYRQLNQVQIKLLKQLQKNVNSRVHGILNTSVQQATGSDFDSLDNDSKTFLTGIMEICFYLENMEMQPQDICDLAYGNLHEIFFKADNIKNTLQQAAETIQSSTSDS